MPEINSAALRKLLAEHFSISEITALCFDPGVAHRIDLSPRLFVCFSQRSTNQRRVTLKEDWAVYTTVPLDLFTDGFHCRNKRE